MKAIVKKIGQKGVFVKDTDFIENLGVTIRTLYTGVCGTDREIANDALPFIRAENGNELIIGHEAIGIVEDPGDSDQFKKGDLVVPMVRRPGKCQLCKIGHQDYCIDGDFVEAGIRGKNGFMREKFRDDEKFLLKVKDKEIQEIGVLTEPTKNVMKIMETFKFLSSRVPWYCGDSTFSCKNLYIYGTGSEALLISFVFSTLGFNIFLVNRHPVSDKIQSIINGIGASFLDSSSEDYENKLSRNRPDVIIDAVGSSEILRKSVEKINNNGIIILFGTSGQLMEKNEDITGYIVDKNISIAGSVDGSKENYREAIEFISSNKNRFPFKDLISGIGSPENIDKIAKKDKDEIKYIIKW